MDVSQIRTLEIVGRESSSVTLEERLRRGGEIAMSVSRAASPPRDWSIAPPRDLPRPSLTLQLPSEAASVAAVPLNLRPNESENENEDKSVSVTEAARQLLKAWGEDESERNLENLKRNLRNWCDTGRIHAWRRGEDSRLDDEKSRAHWRIPESEIQRLKKRLNGAQHGNGDNDED